ncbi:MAG: histidine phosphatase family protein [Flavobacteriaceae bacterium]|nr:histidine phosphatase family protein [Flavobacteriaceae bacterium]
MKLILLRHGETRQNIERIIQGQTPGDLTERGVQQAKAAAQRLKSEAIDVIYSSDLKRVRDTLQEISAYLKHEVVFTELLRERGFGVAEGGTADEFFKLREKHNIARVDFKPEGGESYIDVRTRVQSFFDLLRSKHAGSTVLACTHGGTIRVLVSLLLELDLDEALDIPIDNTSFTTFEFTPDWRVLSHKLNCVNHLAGQVTQTGMVR